MKLHPTEYRKNLKSGKVTITLAGILRIAKKNGLEMHHNWIDGGTAYAITIKNGVRSETSLTLAQATALGYNTHLPIWKTHPVEFLKNAALRENLLSHFREEIGLVVKQLE